MSNVYLEKIANQAAAAAAGKLGDAFSAGAKAVGRVAKKATKAYGNQIHLSFGGAFREHAHDVLGIRDPYQLAEFGSGKERINKLYEASKKKLGPAHSDHEWNTKILPGLKAKQTDARIALGATTATGLYGASKIKEKLQAPQTQTYYNY